MTDQITLPTRNVLSVVAHDDQRMVRWFEETTKATNELIAGGGGGGVTDGDKGDIVVSGLGTVWTLEPDAVRAAPGYAATVTTGGTTTLSAGSADVQVFTGTLAQTIVLPDVTTLALGRTFTIVNEAVVGLTVQSSGLNSFSNTVQTGQTVQATCIALTGTGTASWSYRFDGSAGRTGLGNQVVFARGPTFRDGPIFEPSDASFASLRIEHGVAPAAPVDGDVWTTTAGMFVQVNGATVGPLGAGGGVTDGDKGDVVVSGSGTVWTIDAGAVTQTKIAAGAVINTKLANIASGLIKGRATAGTGNVEDLTAAQATALLDTFTDVLKGLAPASGGGTINFLRADGSWSPFIIENRTSDPGSPATGQMWLRTDL